MIKDYCGSYYGNYRNPKFTNVWDNVDAFMDDYGNVGIPTTISNESAETLFYLLYGKYGNSTVAASDLTRFKYRLFSIIWQYGPTWEKKLDIQKLVREWQHQDIQLAETFDTKDTHNISSTGSATSSVEGSADTNMTSAGTKLGNYADNPSTEPSTIADTPLTYVNRQDYNKDSATSQTSATNTSTTKGSDNKKEEGTTTHHTTRNRGIVDSYLALWNLLADDVTEEFLNKFKPLFLKFVQPELPLWYVVEGEDNE